MRRNMFTQKLSAYTYGPMFHVSSNSNEKVLKFIVNSHLRKRSSGRCECHYSSEHSLVCCFQPRAENNRIGTCNGKGQQSEHVRGNRIRAHYKSEDIDITEAKVDALRSSEGTSEAALVEGNAEETYPWWEQFPKRWVIVLLCFLAFLLCNMDRVSNCFFVFGFSYMLVLFYIFSSKLSGFNEILQCVTQSFS